MTERVVMSEGRDAFINHFRCSRTLAQRLSVLALLLLVALMTVSCGTVAQAAGSKGNGAQNNLGLYGMFPEGTVSVSYKAGIVVVGGTSPYQFSVKTGALPPGVSMNPATGMFSGTPTKAGNFAFDVIVTDPPNLDSASQTYSIVVTGTGGGGGGGAVKVSVSPTSVTLFSNQTQQFTATVSGTANTGVTWSATAGSVNASGLYTAPTVKSQTSAVVTATSNADSSKSASAAVTIDPVNNQTLQITTGSLPQGQQGNTYSEVFSATGGTTPYVNQHQDRRAGDGRFPAQSRWIRASPVYAYGREPLAIKALLPPGQAAKPGPGLGRGGQGGPVKVRRVSISNFRGVRSGTVLLDSHSLLVGGNAVGKSTICEALDLALGLERLYRRPVIDEYDFYEARYRGDDPGQDRRRDPDRGRAHRPVAGGPAPFRRPSAALVGGDGRFRAARPR